MRASAAWRTVRCCGCGTPFRVPTVAAPYLRYHSDACRRAHAGDSETPPGLPSGGRGPARAAAYAAGGSAR